MSAQSPERQWYEVSVDAMITGGAKKLGSASYRSKPLAAERNGLRMWSCPTCQRKFTRKNQRHACGTGKRSDVLRNRPAEIVGLYSALESYARSLGKIEVVARERYVLLRTVRIFADLVIMKDAVRVAIHLGRRAGDPIFVKIAGDARQTSHVAMLRKPGDLATIKPYLKEAYEFSLRESRKSQ